MKKCSFVLTTGRLWVSLSWSFATSFKYYSIQFQPIVQTSNNHSIFSHINKITIFSIIIINEKFICTFFYENFFLMIDSLQFNHWSISNDRINLDFLYSFSMPSLPLLNERSQNSETSSLIISFPCAPAVALSWLLNS